MNAMQALAVTKLLNTGNTLEFQELHKKFVDFVPGPQTCVSISLSNGEVVIIPTNGKLIYINAEGKYHRVGKPAVVYPNGDVEFWENDMFIGTVGEEVYF